MTQTQQAWRQNIDKSTANIVHVLCCYCCSGENQDKVVQEGGFEAVVRLLSSPSMQVQRWALNAIGILCMDNGKYETSVVCGV